MNPRLHDIDLSLYFITDSTLCQQAGRTVPQTVRAAVAGGAGIVQMRDKHINDDQFYALTREVIEVVEQVTEHSHRSVPVVLNDRVAVAQRLLAEGIEVHLHLGQDDLPVSEARQLLGEKPLIGLSAATPEEFEIARASGGVDLFGIGPVFSTVTKSDAGDALGVATLQALAQQAQIPAVAIGGIDEERAPLLRDVGVRGICVVSAICLAADPELAARRLYHAFSGETFHG